MNSEFRANKHGPLWIDLWTTATSIDFGLAKASSQGEAGILALFFAETHLVVYEIEICLLLKFALLREATDLEHEVEWHIFE